MSVGAHPEPQSLSAQGKHFSCSMTAVLVGRVREYGGDAAVAELLRAAGSDRSAQYLTDIANWISFDEGVALWRAGAQVTHHPEFARAVGEDAARYLNASPVANLLRQLGSLEVVYGQIATTATKYSTATILEAVDCGPGFAEIHATPVRGFPRDANHCAWTYGMLTQPAILFGLPPAVVHHDRCAAYGAPRCEYRVTWLIDGADADTDPTQQIAGLHAQLDAMKLRLNSMFQTASDLISSGDIDEVLARIADRAAIEVRAPRHMLAVRMTADGPLHCHHKGFDVAEVAEHAERLLTQAVEDLPDSWLVVPVRSNRREYGWLLATCDEGGRFFELERELLEVYARYAASALDSATGLLESEQRYEQSSALLELARALAQAGTSAEIARRLADAVPPVVDCDRVAVYLWDDERHELTRSAHYPLDATAGPVVSDRSSWAPEPGGTLEAFLRDPNRAPQFVGPEDGIVGQIMSGIGMVGTIMVPLAVPGEFLGLLSVSVRERPERLHLTDDLTDRLSGVVAQATTALQNGRLVDLITHQANHDQLTGLANRLRFTTELRDAVSRAHTGAESGALLYVDLDRFKPVNDEFGHEIGDALLVAVAQRLQGCTRASDVVARLGGDEFAVLLVAAGPEEIEKVSERIAAAFAEPFVVGELCLRLGASIGRSLYPVDAGDPDGLLRRADSAMFAVKRAHHAERLTRRQSQAAA
ncbi:MAG TPA: diguanylate cyclase [Solirubrobacteraceae bacterium]|jgi:diguanylate cyclase (GGDEF)-like protein|nr:diguanylate cyclase [Solirubrobacteraceae bacterium]